MVTLDPERRTVTVNGQAVHFTKLEFDVLDALVRADGRVLSWQWFLDNVWDTEPRSERYAVRVQMSTLRRKLGSERHRLVTVWGVGWRFVTE